MYVYAWTSKTNGSFYVDNDKVTVVTSVKININNKPNKLEYTDNEINDYKFSGFTVAFSYLPIFLWILILILEINK